MGICTPCLKGHRAPSPLAPVPPPESDAGSARELAASLRALKLLFLESGFYCQARV